MRGSSARGRRRSRAAAPSRPSGPVDERPAPVAARTAPATPPAPAPAAAESLTPTGRQWWRRRRGWVAIAAGILVIAIGTLFASGGALGAKRPLDPASAAPDGALAINRVLAAHGVETRTAESLDELRAVVDERTTVLVHDFGSVLDAWGWEQVRALEVERLVVVPIGSGARTAIADVATVEGVTSAPEEPAALAAGGRCEPGLAERAPGISDFGGIEWRPADDAEACWQARDGYRVVVAERGGVEVVVLGASPMLMNDHLAADANAAAALNLLGASERFVWYEPGPDDVVPTGEPSFESYIPQWLLPATLLLLTAGAAAALWRGRRFGPLVAERLPVAEPASETLEGRARLYALSDARLRALDAIRIGTVGRLAALLGLGREARVEAIADATAVAARVPREHAHRVLVGAMPGTDAELVDLANACAELERRVRAATGRTEPSGRDSRAARPDAGRPDATRPGAGDPVPDRTPPRRTGAGRPPTASDSRSSHA